MKNFTPCFILFLLFVFGCSSTNELEQLGQHYQKYQDYESLSKAVALIPLNTDTSFVQRVLGKPIDMGFDYRYLVDSTSQEGCAIGAVFHINEGGKIDQKWIDAICE